MKTSLFANAGLLALALFSSSAAQAEFIDSTGGTSVGPVAPFGSPDTATYGQTFQVGGVDTVLNSFSLYLSGNAVLNLRGYVGAWDGSKVSSIVYTSSTLPAPMGTNQELQFSTGALQLVANSQYVAFLSISELLAQPTASDTMPLVSGSTIAGDFVFLNNGTNFASLTANNWSNFGPGAYDVWFKATLSEAAVAVPEPGSMALVGAALLGAALVGRRRRAA